MADFVYILIILLIAIGGMGISVFYIKRETRRVAENKPDEAALVGLIKQDLKEIRDEMARASQSSMATMQSQLRESSRIVSDVTEKLTKLDETNKQVIGFAEQLQSLENILRNPKQRGILGEYSLEILLKNAFTAKQYQMQYSFKDGQTVDAVLFVADKIIPVDSKFSLENYNRIVGEKDQSRREQLEKIFSQDLKTRIDETAKYVRPQEGTFEFALMFIPSEAVYYDLLVNQVGAIKSNTRDLLEYAIRDKKVHIVSPNSFYAYLQTILQGLRGFQIERSAMEIRKGVEVLGRHLVGFEEYMKKLGGHLGTVVNTYSAAYKELAKIDKDVVKIAGGEKSVEPLQIDKPSVLE